VYGLVNGAIEDRVSYRCGRGVWEKIKPLETELRVTPLGSRGPSVDPDSFLKESKGKPQ